MNGDKSISPRNRLRSQARPPVFVTVPFNNSGSKPLQNNVLVPLEGSIHSHSIAPTLEELANVNVHMQEQIDGLQREVEEYKAELESLQVFLDTHDHVDPSTIANQLELINCLIEQEATELSFQLDNLKGERKILANRDFITRMHDVSGRSLVEALVQCDNDDSRSTLLLQYAFQAAIVFYLSQIFNIGKHKGEKCSEITHLADLIRAHEIQPVYGRWRSLTYKYLQNNIESKTPKRMITSLSSDILGLAMLLGIRLSQKEYRSIKRELNTSLSEIANKTLRLATTVMTQTISRDYDLFSPSGRFNLDSANTPSQLGKTPGNDHVVTTIAVGMISSRKPDRQQVKSEERVFLKATVVTEANIEELMGSRCLKRKRGVGQQISRKRPRRGLSSGPSCEPLPPSLVLTRSMTRRRDENTGMRSARIVKVNKLPIDTGHPSKARTQR